MQNPVHEDRPGPRSSSTIAVVAVLLLVGILSVGSIVVVSAKWKMSRNREIAETLLKDDDPAVRCRSLWWLGEFEDHDGAIRCIESLDDRAPEVRIMAAWALGEIKDRVAIRPLIEVLEEDDDVLVREMAALALGEIEHPSAVDALEEAFQNDRELRGAVIWALGEIENRGSYEAGDARLAAFDQMDTRPRRNQQVWTGELERFSPKSGSVRDLLKDLDSRRSRTRREAALGLGWMGIHERYDSEDEVLRVVDALIETLRDPEPEVRAAAVWSLDEINPSRWGL